MVRMVTADDLARHPEFHKMGVSVNQYFDFVNENPLLPQPRRYSNPHYDITESPVDYGAFAPKPKKWSKFFDKIYVINLKKRKDRMQNAVNQLNKYSIPFERIEAIENENGAEGLRLTMEKLFKACIKEKYQNIIVFEDDLDIIEPKINDIMQQVVADIPDSYDIIYLGCNLCTPPTGYHNKVLLKGIRNAFATHAAIYSLKAMKAFIKQKPYAPVDNFIVEQIQPKGNCYSTVPMLVSQIVSHSDIYSDTATMDWTNHLQLKYPQMINGVKKDNG